jgi:hypothetical protein
MGVGRYTHRINPRTSVFGDFSYFTRDFESPGNDYVIYRPTVGVEHAFSRTLSTRLQVGYFLQDPERGSNQDGVYFDGNLTQTSERTTYTIALQNGYTEDYFTSENLGFALYHRLIGTITHRPLQRLTLGVTGSLEFVDYVGDAEGREDWIWGVSGSASYEVLKWLTLSLIGSYREDNSTIDINDYTEYRGVFRVTARF